MNRQNKSLQRDGVICFLERFAGNKADSMADFREKNLPYHQKRTIFELFLEEFERLYNE